MGWRRPLGGRRTGDYIEDLLSEALVVIRLLLATVLIYSLSEAVGAAVIFDDLSYANPTAASLVGDYPPQMFKNAVGGVLLQPQLHPAGTLH